jgi:hypothetical protein
MAPKVPAKPAWWQAAAAFQLVRTPNFAERTVARHNPVTNTRRASPPICFRTSSTSIKVEMAPIWAFCAPFD